MGSPQLMEQLDPVGAQTPQRFFRSQLDMRRPAGEAGLDCTCFQIDIEPEPGRDPHLTVKADNRLTKDPFAFLGPLDLRCIGKADSPV